MFGSAIIEREKSTGKLYINMSYNKVNFEIRDMNNNILCSTSTSKLYTVNKISIIKKEAKKVANQLVKRNIKNIDVIVNGFGIELMAILAPITSQGIKVNKIKM